MNQQDIAAIQAKARSFDRCFEALDELKKLIKHTPAHLFVSAVELDGQALGYIYANKEYSSLVEDEDAARIQWTLEAGATGPSITMLRLLCRSMGTGQEGPIIKVSSYPERLYVVTRFEEDYVYGPLQDGSDMDDPRPNKTIIELEDIDLWLEKE